MKKFYGVIAFAIAMAFSLLLAACQPVEWYYVSFDGNGAILDMETIQMENGKTIILPENAFDNGVYEFLGWDNGDEILQPGQKVAIRSDVNYQAVWGTPVTLDFGDHQETFFVQIGNEITVPSGKDLRVEVPEGYEFYGWGTDDQAFIYGDQIIAGEPIILHVILGHKVSVTYDGVTQTKLYPDGYEYQFDFDVPEGYEFYGMVEGDEVFDLDTVVTVDREYNFVATLGHTLGITVDGVREEVILPVDYAMPLEAIEDETELGRTFMGWEIGDELVDPETELVIDKDYEITAVYGYKVTTYADDVVEVNVYREGSEVTVSAPAQENIPEGKQFYVWDDPVNEEEYDAGDTIIINKDYEFDAVWGYNITINVNDSTRVIVYPEGAGYKFPESEDLYKEGEDTPYKYYYGWEKDGEDGYYFEGQGFIVDKDYEITVVYGHYVRYIFADDFSTNPSHDSGWMLAPENGYAVDYYVLPEDMEGSGYRFYGWWDYNNYWDNYGEPLQAYQQGLMDFETFYYDYYLVYEDIYYNVANAYQDIVNLTADKVFWAFQGFDVTIISEGEVVMTDFVPEGSLDWPLYANAIEPQTDPDYSFFGFMVNSDNDYTDAVFKYNWAEGGGMDVISGEASDDSMLTGSIYVYEDITVEFIWGYSITVINGYYYSSATGYVIDYAYEDVVLPGSQIELPEWTQPTNPNYGEFADPDYTFYAWYEDYSEEFYAAGEEITVNGELFFEPQRGYKITVHGEGLEDASFISPEYYGLDWYDMLDQIFGAPETLEFYGILVNDEDGYYYEDALYKFDYDTYYFVYESGFSYATNYSNYYVYVFGEMDVQVVWGVYISIEFDNEGYEDIEDVFAIGTTITLIEPEMPEGDDRKFYGWLDYNYYYDNYVAYVYAYYFDEITYDELIELIKDYEDKFYPAGEEIEVTENASFVAVYTYNVTLTDGESVEEADILEGEEIYLSPNNDPTFYGWNINGEIIKQVYGDEPIELVMDQNYEIEAVYGYYVVIDFAGLADNVSDVYLPGETVTLPEGIVPEGAAFYGWLDYTFDAAYAEYKEAYDALMILDAAWEEAYGAFEEIYDAYQAEEEGVTLEDVQAAYAAFAEVDEAYGEAYAAYQSARANAMTAMDEHDTDEDVYFEAGEEIELGASYYLLSTYTYHIKLTIGEYVEEADLFPDSTLSFSALLDPEFYGWNVDGETTKMLYTSEEKIEITMDQNHDVEAVFGYFVSIDYDGLDENTFDVYLPGDKITLPAGVAPDGAKFYGWFDNTTAALYEIFQPYADAYVEAQNEYNDAEEAFMNAYAAYQAEEEGVTLDMVMAYLDAYQEAGVALQEASDALDEIAAACMAIIDAQGDEPATIAAGAEVELDKSYTFLAIYTYSITITIGEETEVVDIPSGTEYNLEPEEDYTFYGWIVDDELTKQINGSDVEITLVMNKNYEVEAVFGKYVFIDDSVSDMFYDVYLMDDEVTVTLPEVEAPEGKTFVYWIDLVHFNEHYQDEGFVPSTYADKDEIEVDQNYFFSAVYGYNVSIDGVSSLVVEGDMISLEAKESRTFYGWNINEENTKQIYGDEPIDIFVYEDYSITSVYGAEVKFVNGDEIAYDVIVAGDDGISVTAATAPEGKQFYAWRLAVDTSSVDYKAGEVFAIEEKEEIAESYVFTAIFGYNITVDDATEVFEEGTKFTLPVMDEVPEGEVFYGWMVDEEPVEYFGEEIEIDVDGDHNIEKVTGYEVTLIIGEEEVVSKYLPDSVVAIEAPAATQIPEGKTFYGWKITRGETSVTVKCVEDVTLVVSAYELTVDCAITVEAVWGYTVTYAKTAGDPSSYVYEEGTDVTVFTFFEAFGIELSEYAVFAGWKVNESEDFYAEGYVIESIDQNYVLQATIYY